MKTRLLVVTLALTAASARAENSWSQVLMDFETLGSGNEFLKWPYPSEHVRVGSMIAFHPHSADCAGQMGLHADMARSMDMRPPAEQGFGLTTAIYFPTHHTINPATLPTLTPARFGPPRDPHPSLGANTLGLPVGDARLPGFVPPSVYLMGVQVGSPDFGKLYPLITGNKDAANGTGFGPIAAGMYNENGNACLIPPACVCASLDWFTTDNCHCQDDVIVAAPYQGVALRPNTLYAAVVTSAVTDTSGVALRAPDSLAGMLATRTTSRSCRGPEGHGMPPGAACSAYMTALDAIASLPSGASLLSTMVGLTVFRTADPTVALQNALSDARTSHTPTVTTLTLDTDEYPATETPTGVAGVMPDYCVYKGLITLPNYQSGSRPYNTDNTAAEAACLLDPWCMVSRAFDPRSYVRHGGWFDYDPGSSTPKFQSMDSRARIWVTVPRKPVPAGGYPVAVFARSGGGGDRPLMDRRAQTTSHGYVDTGGVSSCSDAFPYMFGGGPCSHTRPDQPGMGPAVELARAGYAGLMIDDPMSSFRNGGAWGVPKEDDKIFNALNLSAMRDNLRQAALELALVADLLRKASGSITFDASSCPARISCDVTSGTCPAIASGMLTDPFDGSRVALIGHSVGAQVGPIAYALQDGYGLSIFGGHNGSYISNVVYKVDPKPGDILFGHDIHTMRDIAELGAVLRAQIDGEGSAQVNTAQQVLEAGDSPVYNATLTAPRMVRVGTASSPRNFMLSIQGLIDHYIEPPIAKAADFTAGLGLAVQTASPVFPFGALDTAALFNDTTVAHGPRDDVGTMYPLGVDNHGFRPTTSDLDLSGFTTTTRGRGVSGLPTQLVTQSLVTQHLSDGIQDGHEVMFQVDAAKHEYKCLLRSWYLDAQFPAAPGFERGPMVPQATNDEGDTGTCWAHSPNKEGRALINTSDCCVAIICQTHPSCCKSRWDATCVAAYEATFPACNGNPVCKYLGSSDLMSAAARSDDATYGP